MNYIDDGMPLLHTALDHRGSIAQAVQDLALVVRSVGPVPFALLHQTDRFVIPQEAAPAGTTVEFASVIIDLSRWGLVADQAYLQPDAVVTKGGPGGTRVVTKGDYGEWWAVPGVPSPDPTLPGVEVGCEALAPAEPGGVTPSVFKADIVGVMGIELGGSPANSRWFSNQCRFIRLVARRTDYVFTPEEAARAADYQIHFNVTGSDCRVPLMTLDVPAANNAVLYDGIVDLRHFGMKSFLDDCRLLFEMVRGENAILSSESAPPNPYTGEVYDPPTYPVIVKARQVVTTPLDDYHFEPSNFGMNKTTTIYGGTNTAEALQHDAWLSDPLGWCTQGVRSEFRLTLWRSADAGAVEYVPTRGAAPVPIPAGVKDGCKIRVTLLRPGAMQHGLYPYLASLDNEFNSYRELSRIGALETRVSLLEPGVYTTATIPAPDATWGGREIYVKDPGVVGKRMLCRETAVDGVYEWVDILTG